MSKQYFAGGSARTVATFALLGTLAGAAATVIIEVGRDGMAARFHLAALEIELSPLTLVPGLVFGLVIGLALRLRKLASPWTYAAYVLASTVSYFAAVHLAIESRDALGSMWLTGVAAGLFGAACLTGLSALMFPFARRLGACGLMLLAGAVLGTLLGLGDGFWYALILFAAWQAGYAASLATALPVARA